MISKDIIHNNLVKINKWLGKIDFHNYKTWLVFTIILLFVFFSLILLFTLGLKDTPSTEGKATLKETYSNKIELLSRYYLYPPQINIKKKEYIISLEKINSPENKKNLLDDILESDLFQREEESIQVQINTLHH